MPAHHDVVVIGAGFAGLYAVHKFRDELGLSVQGFEAAGGVGGTWLWNRYPGARCDIESVHYSYSFSDDLQREWQWSEKYAGQQEILAYLEWVADELDLRRAFQFHTRVTFLRWDEESARWTVGIDDGSTCTARFVISAVGSLSQPKSPEFTGIDTFEGELYRTSSWPDHPVDLTGKRVAVVGTGSSGIQIIQEIAEQAGHLTVFQRTPNYSVPLGNAPVDVEQRRWNSENWKAVRADSRKRVVGLPYEWAPLSALQVTPEERRRVYDRAWERGGIPFLLSTFNDLMWDQNSNDTVAEYVRERIRERVHNPVTAELLCPTDHPYGAKRPTFEEGYYEAFNLPHVDIVDVRATPIEAVTPTGIRTSQESYEFDVIILATGFDAFTGASLAIPTTGRDGVTLQDKWAHGPKNYLGLQISGFPNLFSIAGPLSAFSQDNTPLLVEDQIDFTAGAVQMMRSCGARTIDALPEAERTWVDMAKDVFAMSLWAKAEDSVFNGGNIAGKPKSTYVFHAGAPLYRAILDQVAESGYAGLAIDGGPTNLPPLVALPSDVALIVAAMLASGTPLDEALTALSG